jgi:hypothetical protein
MQIHLPVWCSAVLALLWAAPALAEDPEIGHGRGPSVCNCTGTPQTGVDVPHASAVAVTIISEDPEEYAGQHSTGLSGTAYSNQTLPNNTCFYVHYIFECEQVGPTWECNLLSYHMDSRDAEIADCD